MAQTTFLFSEQTKKELLALTDLYLNLKNALVETSPEQSKTATKALVDFINGKISAEFNEITQINVIRKIIQNMHTSNDVGLIRKEFIELSQILIHLNKGIENRDKPLFIQFCPMADNDKGAFWISEEEAVRNPYYGSMMLECGEVTEMLK